MEQSVNQELNRELSSAEFKFVEYKLFNYIDNKQVIEAVTEQRENLLQSTRHKEPGVPANQGVGKPTESMAIQLMMLEQKAERELFWIRAIEDVLKILPEEDKLLVELKYFEGYLSNAGVARRLNISEREFYNRRSRIVRRFANRFALI